MIRDRFLDLLDRVKNSRTAVLSLCGVAVLALILVGFAACTGDDETSAANESAPIRLDEQPRNLTWVAFQGVQVPVAEQGPRRPADPAPTGYSRSPAGAALAAIQATIRMSVATDSQFPKVSATLLAPGDGRDWFIANRLRVSTTDSVAAEDAPHVVAYRVLSYKDEVATVDIFTRYPDRSLTVNHATVAWTSADDWGLVVPRPETMTGPAVESIDSVPANAVTLPQPN